MCWFTLSLKLHMTVSRGSPVSTNDLMCTFLEPALLLVTPLCNSTCQWDALHVLTAGAIRYGNN